MLPLKPKQLGLFFKPIEYRKRFGMSVSAYLHVPFAQSEAGTLWGEQALWTFLGSEMAVPVIDEGVSKLTSEFLVHGSAYTQPDQRQAVAVRARLGNVEKTVLAFGDRYWDGKNISQPAPFERMPLIWSKAYGGPDFPANPQGKGRVSEEGLRWLPNLEHPASRIQTPDQAVVPACYGAIDLLHPQRVAMRGTYDEAWTKEHAPGFPPDINWKYFNMAPRDQWLESPLRGDEPFSLENLHPSRPLIEGRLPGLRVRAFAARQVKTAAGTESKLREVSMRLSTVWFFPHAERMVLVFHGLAECIEDDGADIKHLLGAVERIGEGHARSDAHYLDVLKKRTEGREMAFEILNDEDLIPTNLDVVDPSEEATQASFKIEGIKEEAMRNRARIDVAFAREDLKAQGKDPDALGVVMPEPEPKPKPSEMAQYYKKLRLEQEKQEWAVVDDALTLLEKVMEMNIDPAKLVPPGPPKLKGIAILEQSREAATRAGKPFDAAAIAPKLQQLDLSDQVNYLEGAHLQLPVVPLKGEAAATCRREFEWLLQRGIRSFLTMDLTGADLSGMDLRGLDFTGAWLESANLSGCNLSRAIFVSAVLAHANLRDTIAIRTNFSGANLGAANLQGTVLDQAQLDGTILMRTILTNADFRGARISQANSLESKWSNVDWTGADAPNLTFLKLDLRTANFAGANLKQCVFVECDLRGAEFQGANLETANFVGCKLDGARFIQARMPGAVFTTESVMKRTSFAGALLKGANLGLCDLEGASFVRAVLDGAHFANSNLPGADLRQASAKGAFFRKANLAGARLAQADLKDAILGGADLRGADLRDVNLFGSDLSRVHLDTDVRLEGALLERARIYPRLRPAQRDAASS